MLKARTRFNIEIFEKVMMVSVEAEELGKGRHVQRLPETARAKDKLDLCSVVDNFFDEMSLIHIGMATFDDLFEIVDTNWDLLKHASTSLV